MKKLKNLPKIRPNFRAAAPIATAAAPIRSSVRFVLTPGRGWIGS